MSNAEDHTDDAHTDDARAQALVAAYYADPARRLTLMRDLFNRSARYYNLVNLLVSLGSGAWYRRFCLRRAGLRPGKIVVDIATGTGLLAREALTLTGKTGTVIGVDVSEAMLAIAQRNLGIPLIQASAEALPFKCGIADFVTMGYALRHVADLQQAFTEAKRILRPGGTMLLLEVSAPRNRISRALAGVFIGFLIPRLSQLTARDVRARNLMQYHWQTILSYMPPDVVMRVMRDSGFEKVACTSYIDLFHYYIGHKPHDGA
jgi:demethylmenaquinone methyltransferase/2-methoxy-6-polyprenyl-1,4-benzoquinol methylase